MPRSLLAGLILALFALPAFPQDVLTLGTGEAPRGEVVTIPVFVLDRTGTPLGADAGSGNRIQGIAFKVLYPQEFVQSVSFARGGVTASLTPMFETTLSGSGWFSYVGSFAETSSSIPFTANAPAPGNAIGSLNITLSTTAPPGTVVVLRLDASSAILSNQSSTLRETVAAGTLAVVNGSAVAKAATAVVFTDDPLVPGTTPIKAVHITELRDAVNAFRVAAGLSALAPDASVAVGAVVRAQHVNDLRTALNEARTQNGLAPLSFTDTITPGATTVRAVHIEELRNGVR